MSYLARVGGVSLPGRLGVCLGLLGVVSCGDDFQSQVPADVAGRYQLNITRGANGCELADWTEGTATTGSVLVTQDDTQVQAMAEGLLGGFLALIGFQTATFEGTVEGNVLSMSLPNVYDQMPEGTTCVYTWLAELDATVEGDVLDGTLTLVPRTNGSNQCGVFASCQNVMLVNGTRPATAATE